MVSKTSKGPKTSVRPLRARPGARFICVGDGLCCTDVHGLGPVSKKEVAMLEMVGEETVGYSKDGDCYVLKMHSEDGSCVFVGEAGCAIHTVMDGLLKPRTCWRYPYGLVATPSGGRVTTQQGCPCRTLGERPLVDLKDAEPSLKDSGGRLRADYRVERVRMSSGTHISFEEWEVMETSLFERLKTETPEAVLNAKPFPELRESTWNDMADTLEEIIGASRAAVACHWFGDALRLLLNGAKMPDRLRPWGASFERAQDRSPESPEHVEALMLADWVADKIWSLSWVHTGGLEFHKQLLVTRLAVIRTISKKLRAEKVRPDRATAEAIMIADNVVGSGLWREVVKTE